MTRGGGGEFHESGGALCLAPGPLRLLRLLRLSRLVRLIRSAPELLTLINGMRVASRAPWTKNVSRGSFVDAPSLAWFGLQARAFL